MANEQNGSSRKKPMAMLIDGDNAQAVLIKEILAECSKYGRVTIRRIYGDWTMPNMNSWKERLQENAIQPIQQFRYTVGKNATDSAMIIDAMDVLHSGHVEAFCLVTSDSDYTRLATRLRESGAFVMGIGKNSTPKAFTSACDLFVFVENLGRDLADEVPSSDKKEVAAGVSPAEKALPLLQRAFKMSVQEDGWAHLSTMGASLRSLESTFDQRTYGCATLRTLVSKFPKRIELKEYDKTSGAPAMMRFK